MAKYNETNRCPKCNGGASTRYVNDRFMGGQMKRECVRCGYSWHEEPLDADDRGAFHIPARSLGSPLRFTGKDI